MSRKFKRHFATAPSRMHPLCLGNSTGEGLQTEEPVCCEKSPGFHFHAALTGALSPTLILVEDQVRVRVLCETPVDCRLNSETLSRKKFQNRPLKNDSPSCVDERRSNPLESN
jgi:hypothetical protein